MDYDWRDLVDLAADVTDVPMWATKLNLQHLPPILAEALKKTPEGKTVDGVSAEDILWTAQVCYAEGMLDEMYYVLQPLGFFKPIYSR